MKQAYVAIRMKMDDFLKGQNPTTQPGVRMPYYPREHQAMDAAVRQSQNLEHVPGVRAYFVATVNVEEVIYGKLDTLNPNDVHALTMAICKPGETPNQENTLHIFRNGLSLQQMADMARTVFTQVQHGASIQEVRHQMYLGQEPGHIHVPKEYTAGYGMQELKTESSPDDTFTIISEHHSPESTAPQTFVSEYAVKQFEFLPDALYQQAMSAFNDKMSAYAQSPALYANRDGYEAAAVTYAMQAIAENVTMQYPDISRQAYDTMCAAQKLASERGVDWSEMEYRPEADHSKYLAEHCQGMTAGMAAAVATKYHAFFRESNAYTLPEQQALALHAAVSDITNHRLRYVVSGEMRGNDRKLLENLRDNMSQELADRGIRPGALLDDNRDEQDVGDDAK